MVAAYDFLLLAGWYIFSVVNNIVSKLAVRAFPYPSTMALFGLLAQTIASRVLAKVERGAGKKDDSASAGGGRPSMRAVLGIAVPYVVGLVCHRIAIHESSVHFTHTVKSSSVVFTAVLSYFFLGVAPSPGALLSLAIVLTGIVSATFTELAFDRAAFAAAIFAAVCVAAVSIQQKLALSSAAGGRYELYSRYTLAACFVFVPYWAMTGGPAALGALFEEGSIGAERGALVAGSCCGLLGQEMFGYLLLSRVRPVTHALGNSIRSLFVIGASMFYFSSKSSTLNSAGIGLALFGGLLYTQLKSDGKDAKVKPS